MTTIILPFKTENNSMDNITMFINSDYYRSTSDKIKELFEEFPHFLEYFSMLPLEQLGIPLFYEEVPRKLGQEKRPNFIYPTKRRDIFIHILYDPNDYRSFYIPIEPPLLNDYSPLMRQVDVRLLNLKNKIMALPVAAEKEAKILEYVDQVTVPDGVYPTIVPDKQNAAKLKGKLHLSSEELDSLKYLISRDRIGLGVLEPLISDPYIEDISCSGLGPIFIEHKIFKSLKTSVQFNSTEDLDNYVLWLAERIKKPVTFRNPIVDAALPDGSRINIVYGKEVSRRGSNFTIRKFPGTPTSIFELVEFGSINYQMLAYLSLAIGNGMNLFVSGETASGKTTLLNALTTFINPMAKIVSIEDTPELQVPHKNWIREVVQSTKAAEESGAVNMFDLLKAALRQRPNEIIIGEIRGAEGNIAFQAMQTGHSVMATFHAASVEKLIQRITGSPISVPKTYLDNLNVVVLTSMVKLPTGKMGRRITGIAEIVNYDSSLDSFTFIEAFHWDESRDAFDFTAHMSSAILEQKIAPRLGFPAGKKQKIYSELDRRTKILEKLHKEQKITGFYEVLEVLSKAQREGLF
jgi:flagellar protein FlaI